MTGRKLAGWVAVGALLAGISACDQVQDRVDKFGKLVGDVASQIGGEEKAVDPLADAPLEARALFGKRLEPVQIAAVPLEELLQTQSYYVVGEIVAQPKEEMAEPVVDDSFSVEAATPDAGATAPAPDAPPPAAELPESAAQPAGPPIVEATPPPAPAPEPPAPGGGISTRSLRVLKTAPPTVSAPEMRRNAQIAPRALEKAVKDSGVKIDREAVIKARRSADVMQKGGTQDAQAIGDEIAKQDADKAAPVPRAMAVRSKLNVDVALAARQRAENKMSELGLQGVVLAGEGGQMKIQLGVRKTQFASRDLSKLTAMRDMFARKTAADGATCTGTYTADQLEADIALATDCLIKELKESGEYKYVEKEYIFTNQFMKKPKPKTATTLLAPNDPLFGLQWHFKDNGAAAGQSAGGAGFSNFWQRTKDIGSRSVTVAVIDTGLQMNHPDIKGSANLAPGFDMVSDLTMANDGDGRDPDPNDPGDKCEPNDPTTSDSFHGTHVAGTIGVASTNNKNGVAGGAWDVTIVPVRALGRCGGKLSDINDAIRWAAGKVAARDKNNEEVWIKKPADIINLSIGLFGACPASMQAAIDDAVKAGAIVVTAAGNGRIDTANFAPGGCKNVISVAAGDARGVLAPYSNFGENVTIMAPGGDMTRDDDSDGRPDGVLSTKFSKDCYDPAKPGVQVEQCFYAYENGTSMAAPHVSAALALLKAKFPTALPSQLKTRLLQASTPRDQLQCSGSCTSYPGTKEIPGQPGMCFRPCGGAMLNLANAAVQ